MALLGSEVVGQESDGGRKRTPRLPSASGGGGQQLGVFGSRAGSEGLERGERIGEVAHGDEQQVARERRAAREGEVGLGEEERIGQRSATRMIAIMRSPMLLF